jgi:DnaJ like chaperone protein
MRGFAPSQIAWNPNKVDEMSIWSQITDYVSSATSAAGNVLGGLLEAVRTLFEGDPETRRRVAFSIAMIALSAKMAKADGIVADAEVKAFHRLFAIPAEEARHVERLYNLAKQDVAGFEAYAEKMAGLCGSGERNCTMLEDILDGLFFIATADGVVHHAERDFLKRVSEIFGIEDAHFEAILARHAHGGADDPYAVIGVDRGMNFQEIRRRYRALVRDNHPDRLIARGVPPEFVAIATERIAALNVAFEIIERQHKRVVSLAGA